MRKYLKPCSILILLFWGAAAFVYLPETTRSLNQAATEKLESSQYLGIFSEVNARFHGQEATLTGVVALDEEKQLAEKVIRTEVRLPNERGASHNPVTAVHNEIRVDPNATNRKRPWIIASLFQENQRLDGVLKSSEQRTKLLAQIASRAPMATLNNQILVNEPSLPASAWEATLDQVPNFKNILAGKKDKEQAIIAVTLCDGKWTTFPPTATDAEIATLLQDRKISPHEITHSLHALRAWRTSPNSEEVARLAAEKSKNDAAELALANAQKSAQAEREAQKLATLSPSYIGLTALNQKINLFGQVPAEAQKSQAITSAQSIYPGYEIDGTQITIDASRVLPAASNFTLPAGKDNFIAFATFDGTNKLYPADVFDSEIAKDFPSLKFGDDELSNLLIHFRTNLASAGTITRDEPYVAIATDGKSLILTGEVAEIATKASLLEKVAAANPGVKLVDKVQVSSLVNTVTEFSPTLDSTPNFAGVSAGVAIARLGQKWRNAVVHSIYFKTGSDRSKDQERAIYQMRRVRELLPNASFEVVGHTDDVGSADSNRKLSLERAQSFVSYATGSGFDPAMFTSRGAGQDEPITPNETENGKALNRRVDVMLK